MKRTLIIALFLATTALLAVACSHQNQSAVEAPFTLGDVSGGGTTEQAPEVTTTPEPEEAAETYVLLSKVTAQHYSLPTPTTPAALQRTLASTATFDGGTMTSVAHTDKDEIGGKTARTVVAYAYAADGKLTMRIDTKTDVTPPASKETDYIYDDSDMLVQMVYATIEDDGTAMPIQRSVFAFDPSTRTRHQSSEDDWDGTTWIPDASWDPSTMKSVVVFSKGMLPASAERITGSNSVTVTSTYDGMALIFHKIETSLLPGISLILSCPASPPTDCVYDSSGMIKQLTYRAYDGASKNILNIAINGKAWDDAGHLLSEEVKIEDPVGNPGIWELLVTRQFEYAKVTLKAPELPMVPPAFVAFPDMRDAPTIDKKYHTLSNRTIPTLFGHDRMDLLFGTNGVIMW